MRIVIDMQGAQTECGSRGTGHHTVSFAQAVVRNAGEHEVILALNGLLSDAIEPIRAVFDDLLPQDKIRVWTAPGVGQGESTFSKHRRDIAERLREGFLLGLKPDVVHLSSFFPGKEGYAVTSIGRFDVQTKVTVSLCDLLHFKHGEDVFCTRKLQDLQRASMCFVFSEFELETAVNALGFEPQRVINIGSAPEACFRAQPSASAGVEPMDQRWGLGMQVVLHLVDRDQPNELIRLVEAFAALPLELRADHQLVFSGEVLDGTADQLLRAATAVGLHGDDLVLTGALTAEERLWLYKRCRLCVFLFWRAGSRWLAMEAIACGVPVLGANAVGRPEILDWSDAQFDPHDIVSISRQMMAVLQDERRAERLRSHGWRQVHDGVWDACARQAIHAWTQEPLITPTTPASSPAGLRSKPRLAFVSPLPPERTGIADYSAQLLPALAAHYDIELVVAQHHVDMAWAASNGPVRDVAWLRAHADTVDRVMYHVGNSPFHAHMPALLRDVPGTVVLHDFYLSGLMSWLELHGGQRDAWTTSLYESHGYGAVRDRFANPADTQQHYPVNWRVLDNARGVIVHSNHARDLAQQWFGAAFGHDWAVIPLLRQVAPVRNKVEARTALGFRQDDFVVCSFGFINGNKLHHRLLRAWLASALSKTEHCRLIFVGDNPSNEFGAELLKTIRRSHARNRIQITGFASAKSYEDHLVAADMAVQLRTDSRGETSAAVLDCMNHGLPVVVNGNGALAELNDSAVHMLSDQFDDAELIDALELFWRDAAYRRSLGARASAVISDNHTPKACARKYFEAIEAFHGTAGTVMSDLVERIAQECAPADDATLVEIACAIEQNFPQRRPAARLLLDVTATAQADLKTGIERVVRALLMALIESPPDGFRVEPVQLKHHAGEWRYWHARTYAQSLMGSPHSALADEPLMPEPRDVLLVADFSGDRFFGAAQAGLFERYRLQGVLMYAVVYDLLPIRMPDVFPPTAEDTHRRWLHIISQFDGAACISRTVAEDLDDWRKASGIAVNGRRPYRIGWWHLGADLSGTAPTRGMPSNARSVLAQLRSRPSFLMVGTIEPRKGHLQVIDAFTHLWLTGTDVNLIVVGNEGWKGLPSPMRRNIPQTVERLQEHPESGRRLFWVNDVSDEYLEEIYAASTCLLAASYGEGFGLPLIESAQHGLPMIVRDIPVFREVVGENACYFDTVAAKDLADVIQEWLLQFRAGGYPESSSLAWLTWKASARKLTDVIVGGQWFITAMTEDEECKDSVWPSTSFGSGLGN